MSFSDAIVIEGSGDYLKLVAGTPVTIHILSQTPEKEFVHWKNKKKTICLGRDKCELCIEGDKPKQRWSCSVWDRKELKVKKFEFGSSIATQLKSISELLEETKQTIHSVDIRIKTTGSSLETEYSVLHVPVSGEIPQDVLDMFQVPF